MVKPIPVFEFAFAAYAATGRTGAERIGPREEERSRFETAWRSTAQRDGVLMVKVGVLDDGRVEATALSPCKSARPVKEIWLGQIKEVEGGYCGVVCMAQSPLRTISLGERIDFGPAHILDWTISFEASPECASVRQQPNALHAASELCGDCERAEEALG